MAEQEITTVIENGFIYDFVPNSFGYDSAGDTGQGVPQWYGSAEGSYPDMQDPVVEAIIDEYIEEGAEPEVAEQWAMVAAQKLRKDAEFAAPMATFPAGKHDVDGAIAAVKKKHGMTKTNGKPVYITEREGTSNKFHVFLDTDKGYYNVTGRIGYPGRVWGPLSFGAWNEKLRKKMRKGYKQTKYAEEASLPYAEVGEPVVPNSWGGDSALSSGYGVPQWYGSAEHEQGYNDRDDDSIGMRHRGHHHQSLKDRRDESKGMTGSLHHHLPYSDVSTMSAEGYKNKREQVVTEEAMSDVEYMREVQAAESMGLVLEEPFKTGAWLTTGAFAATAGITVVSAVLLGWLGGRNS